MLWFVKLSGASRCWPRPRRPRLAKNFEELAKVSRRELFETTKMNNNNNTGNKNCFECAICFEEQEMENAFLINDCGHQVCLDCARAIVKHDVVGNQRLPRCPLCLAKDLKETMIQPYGVESLIQGQLLKSYHDLYTGIKMAHLNTYSCPTPDCPNKSIAQTLMDCEGDRFVCSVCNMSSCIKCKARPYHTNETCDECKTRIAAQKTENQENEELLRKLAMKNGWHPCPQCGNMQETDYNQFHMQCANPKCKIHYCGKCDEKLDSTNWAKHFQVGKCELWRSSC